MESEVSEEFLKLYYKKLFPCDLFCRWLTYENSSYALSRREFSFTLAGDVYLRYQSFEHSDAFRKELVKLCPQKIDIGAVYSTAPKNHRAVVSSSFKPEWKELVFDIDLTDYDEVRYCCGEQSSSGSAICARCWPLARSAVLCIDRALRNDFGFKHLLWVYSGRRGVHCWVCDSTARSLDPASRTAIVEYLTLVRGGSARKPILTAGSYSKFSDNSNIEPPLHPCVDAACEILLPRFGAYSSTLSGQNLFGVPKRLEKILSYLPPDMKEQRDNLINEWENETQTSDTEVSLKRWNTLRTFLQESCRVNILKEMVLNYTYPRLDVNVSTSKFFTESLNDLIMEVEACNWNTFIFLGLNHLLKSPFCVHPKTGHICIPFDPQQVDKLDPADVPTLNQVIEQLSNSTTSEELNSSEQGSSTDRHLLTFKKTSLRPVIEYFERFVNNVSESDYSARSNVLDLKNGQSFSSNSIAVF